MHTDTPLPSTPSGRKNSRTTGIADPLFDLTGRVAVITGASSGLGAHFARMLHARGMRVVLGARRGDRLEALARDLGGGALAVPVDLTEVGAAERLVEGAVATFGRLDVMVNNAGSSHTARAETEAVAEFDDVVDIDLKAVYRGCLAAGRIMLAAGGGSIVNIASIAGLVSLSDRYPMAGYVAAKHGLVGITKELGAQWAARSVRVNAIAPGWFPTELTGDLRDPEQVSWIERRAPIGRAGRIDELDAALVFLAGGGSSYVVGQTLFVDGGWTIW